MALNLGELYITIGANTDALKSVTPSLGRIEKAINNLSANIEKLHRTLSNMGENASSSFAKVAKSAQQASDKQAKAAKNIDAALDRQRDTMEKAKIAVDNLNLSLGKMGVGKKFAGQTSEALAKLESQMNSGALSAQEFRNANNTFKNSLNRTRTDAKKLVTQLIELENANTGGVASFFAFGKRANGASARLSGTTSRRRNLVLGMQNASYQIQDIIVQLEMGIPLLRTLGQQLPQLAGGFGPWGAAIGVAFAALAVLVPVLSDTAEEEKKASEAADRHAQNMQQLASITDDYRKSQARLNGTLRQFEMEGLKKEMDDALRVLRNYRQEGLSLTEAQDNFRKAANRYSDAVIRQKQTTLNNIKADLNQVKSIQALDNAFQQGALSLKEYEVTKQLVERVNNEGLQGQAEAIQLLYEQLSIQYDLNKAEKAARKKPKKEDDSAAKLLAQYATLNSELIKSETILQNVQVAGTNAGVSLEAAFAKQDQVVKWNKTIGELKDDQLAKVRVALGMTGASVQELAVAFANLENETANNKTSLDSFNRLLSDTQSLADRISGAQAKGGLFSQLFNPEGAARSADFQKLATDAKASIEKEMAKGGNDFYLTDLVDQYAEVAKKAGMENPFENVDTTNVDQVAKAVAKVNQGVSDLEKSPQKITSAVSQIATQFSSLVSQIGDMYAQQAAYHKQMADEALSYGMRQSEFFMKLADTVHYSNNEQSKSYEQKALAVADASAKQYRAEKAAQDKSNAAAKRAFETQKQMQIAQALMSTATAIAGQLAAPPVGPWNIGLAAALGGLGAAQVGVIQSQQFTPREKGGPITGGKPYLVGEAGPELIVPGQGGTVVNNKDLMNGLGGGSTNITFQIQALDTTDAAKVIYDNRGMIINIIQQAKDQRLGATL